MYGRNIHCGEKLSRRKVKAELNEAETSFAETFVAVKLAHREFCLEIIGKLFRED